jgi:hypothetical protein
MQQLEGVEDQQDLMEAPCQERENRKVIPDLLVHY